MRNTHALQVQAFTYTFTGELPGLYKVGIQIPQRVTVVSGAMQILVALDDSGGGATFSIGTSFHQTLFTMGVVAGFPLAPQILNFNTLAQMDDFIDVQIAINISSLFSGSFNFFIQYTFPE